MPNRSRIVLLYSDRLSRRSVTRPGSLSLPQSSFSNRESIQPVRSSTSALVGFGFPSGGMSPDSTFSTTSCQTFWLAASDDSSVNFARFRPPFGFVSPWHVMQYLASKGAIWPENEASDVAVGFFVSAPIEVETNETRQRRLNKAGRCGRGTGE